MKYLICITAFLMQSCVALHSYSIGEIDNRKAWKSRPIDIKVSEFGVSMEDINQISRSTKSEAGSSLSQIIQLFQQGPRTGLPVYNEHYAERIFDDLRRECPSGQITQVNAIRETNRYPVISGEIIRITGRCLSRR